MVQNYLEIVNYSQN